jgi:hypothetical protein
MKRQQIIYFLLLTLLTGACHKEQAPFTDMPIIESYIMPGSIVSVKIKRQIPFSSEADSSSDDINNLTVNLKVDNVNHILKPAGGGEYVDSTLVIKEGTKLYLSFKFNNTTVSASTAIPLKPINFEQSATVFYMVKMEAGSGPPSSFTMPDPISLTWTNTDDSYYIVLVENIEPSLVAIQDFGNRTPPGNRFRKSPSNATAEEISPMEFRYFGRHRIILYHVLPDYASLYKENSTSSQNLTNPSTSIANGYGIFTGMNTDTLMVTVKQQ